MSAEDLRPPKCQTCGDPLGGSPGIWYSLATGREQCGEPFHYHEPSNNDTPAVMQTDPDSAVSGRTEQ